MRCWKGRSKTILRADGKKEEAPDAVSMDTTWPIAPVGYDGNAYLQLIADSSAGHTQCFPMKKKSEEAAAILKGIRRLEMTLGNTIMRYHSDSTKEQKTKALLNEPESKGTKICSTAPNSSQKNPIVERRLGTIFEETRAALAASGPSRKFWSVACLDAVDKSNYLPGGISNQKGQRPIKDSKLRDHWRTSTSRGSLAFGQHGYILDTTPKKSWKTGRSKPGVSVQPPKHNTSCYFQKMAQ